MSFQQHHLLLKTSIGFREVMRIRRLSNMFVLQRSSDIGNIITFIVFLKRWSRVSFNIIIKWIKIEPSQ